MSAFFSFLQVFDMAIYFFHFFSFSFLEKRRASIIRKGLMSIVL